MAASGHRVILVPSEQTFSPHRVDEADRPRLLEALGRAGIEVVDGGPIERIEASSNGGAPRKVVFADGRELAGDVVMPFYGLAPSLEFMVGSGVDIERGLLVNPELRSDRPPHLGRGRRLPDLERRRQRLPLLLRLEERQGDGRARRAQHDRRRGGVPHLPRRDADVDEQGRLHSAFWEYD